MLDSCSQHNACTRADELSKFQVRAITLMKYHPHLPWRTRNWIKQGCQASTQASSCPAFNAMTVYAPVLWPASRSIRWRCTIGGFAQKLEILNRGDCAVAFAPPRHILRIFLDQSESPDFQFHFQIHFQIRFHIHQDWPIRARGFASLTTLPLQLSFFVLAAILLFPIWMCRYRIPVRFLSVFYKFPASIVSVIN